MPLFYQPDLNPDAPTLSPEESRHCVKVLRQQPGDSFEVVDGKGTSYECTITQADPKRCAFDITKVRHEPGRSYSIHLVIAPTKNLDRMEWLVEKAVEIGVDRMSFIQCEHSERRVLKIERLHKKAIVAMKQSRRATLPTISELQSFRQFLKQPTAADQRFLTYVDSQNPLHLQQAAQPGKSYEVLVGPEGGFSKHEVEMAEEADYKVVSLGPYRLRTETAGLMVCATLNLVNVQV